MANGVTVGLSFCAMVRPIVLSLGSAVYLVGLENSVAGVVGHFVSETNTAQQRLSSAPEKRETHISTACGA